jgi:hypothetical protein
MLGAAFVNWALKAGEGVAGLSAAIRAAGIAVRTSVAAIDSDMRAHDQGLGGPPPAEDWH